MSAHLLTLSCIQFHSTNFQPFFPPQNGHVGNWLSEMPPQKILTVQNGNGECREQRGPCCLGYKPQCRRFYKNRLLCNRQTKDPQWIYRHYKASESAELYSQEQSSALDRERKGALLRSKPDKVINQ